MHTQVDCTIRDGGLMNQWQFTDDFVRAVYNACVEAGVDYMEIGYFSSENKFNRAEACSATAFFPLASWTVV